MTRDEIHALVTAQRAYFDTHATLDVSFRLEMLKKLRDALLQNEARIAEALKSDLGKSAFEGYMCETGLTVSEITYVIRHLRRWAKDRTVPTPLVSFHSHSYVKPAPYGVALIMSPWNYPILLTLEPLADAIAAGNTAILKPSAYSPATSALMAELIGGIFPPEYVAVVTGGREENACLLDERFDTIFFTGSRAVGQLVLEKAAKHLTPVTLELGGKSPVVVDETANLKLTAKRLVFGKLLNCGQTCVAPDYVLCARGVKDRLIEYVKAEIVAQYGADPLKNPDYGKLVNRKHFDRVRHLIDPQKTVHGGGFDPATLQIAPTVLDNVTPDDPVMGEEIFGPILPILTYDKLDDAVAFINARPHPLALYIFSSDKAAIRRVTSECTFGGGCVNDTIIHLATSTMGFGGVGDSGMGAYHGKTGFDAFSTRKSILDKKTWLDLPMRYQPYKRLYGKLIRMFLK